jgi:hypothetical protein
VNHPARTHANREAWQARVIEERDDLNKRLNRLCEFIGGLEYAKLGEVDRELLIEQRSLMRSLSAVLTRRINRFQPSPPQPG